MSSEQTRKRIIAMDCETTGLNPDEDQILSATLRAIDSESGSVIESLPIRLAYRGDVRPNVGAVLATGINPLRHKGVSEGEAALAIKEFISTHGGRESPCLGHNIRFDQRFIRNLLTRNGHDAQVLSLDTIDTYQLAAKALVEGQLKRDQFQGRDTPPSTAARQLNPAEQSQADVPQRPVSLNLTSVAKAVGIKVDESKTHDDAYDTDLAIEVWRRLGKPKATAVGEFNNPYLSQKKFAGKLVKVREWDHRNATDKEGLYYVLGQGAGEIVDGFGAKRYNSTVMVKVDSSDFADLIERGRKGAITQTALDKVVVERKFTSPDVFSLEVLSEGDPRIAELESLRSHILDHVQNKRMKEREERYLERLSAASSQVFYLDDPNNKETLISADNESIIPALAREMAPLPESERIRRISEIANAQTPPKGVVWAHALKVMTERYGYRNGIPGYENSRRETLAKAVASEVEPTCVTKGLDQVESPVRKAMEKSGIAFINLRSDGYSTSVEILDASETIMRREVIAHELSASGDLQNPKADQVCEIIGEMLGCSKTAANSVRKGFSPLSDNYSLSAVRRKFLLAAAAMEKEGKEDRAKVLNQVVDDLGANYEQFLKNTLEASEGSRLKTPRLTVLGSVRSLSPIDEAEGQEPHLPEGKQHRLNLDTLESLETSDAQQEGLRAGVKQRFSRKQLQLYMNEADRIREEMEQAYANPKLYLIKEDQSSTERLIANIKNPALSNKVVDMRVYAAAVGRAGSVNEDALSGKIVEGHRRGQDSQGTSLFTSGVDGSSALSTLHEPEVVEDEELGASMPQLPPVDMQSDEGRPKKRGRKSNKAAKEAALNSIAQCKVCRRWVKGKNVVAGMGPVCARRLAEWLKKPETSHVPEELSKKFKKVGELRESGIYPIMLVRDTVTGRTFAADVIRKERDGRFLVIDLSQVANEGSDERADAMRGTVRVYLDPNNHEVARVFVSKGFS